MRSRGQHSGAEALPQRGGLAVQPLTVAVQREQACPVLSPHARCCLLLLSLLLTLQGPHEQAVTACIYCIAAWGGPHVGLKDDTATSDDSAFVMVGHLLFSLLLPLSLHSALPLLLLLLLLLLSLVLLGLAIVL